MTTEEAEDVEGVIIIVEGGLRGIWSIVSAVLGSDIPCPDTGRLGSELAVRLDSHVAAGTWGAFALAILGVVGDAVGSYRETDGADAVYVADHDPFDDDNRNDDLHDSERDGPIVIVESDEDWRSGGA